MPMPELDPSRFYAAVLADPSHRLPLPGPGALRFFPDEGAVVDSADAFYAQLIADGSLVRKPDPALEEVAESEKPATDPAPAVKSALHDEQPVIADSRQGPQPAPKSDSPTDAPKPAAPAAPTSKA